jgi:transposase
MLKYCVGIDVSKNDFHCCISVIDLQQRVTVKASRKFSNNKEGFKELRLWTEKNHKDKSVPLLLVMEATGTYYELLALYLYKSRYAVSVILANKAKKYLQSTGSKSKNDKIDAQGLSRMGAEQRLDLWQPMDEYFYILRTMTRQHQNLQELKTTVNNQLQALELSMFDASLVIKQQKSLLSTLDKQIDKLGLAIQKHISSEEVVKQRVDKICGIKGLGLLTVAVILAETNGFVLFNNSRQLVCYAGYDVVECQSGKQKGKPKISKKGNSRIRRALHMPAFSVVRFQQTPFTGLFERTLQRHGQKMKSYVAVQKKLLVLVYALWKHDSPYQMNYNKSKHTEEKEQVPSSLHSSRAIAGLNENSANPKGGATQGRHTVEISQFASSLQS